MYGPGAQQLVGSVNVSSGFGHSNAPQAPTQPISARLEELAKSTERLHAIIVEFEVRLCVVLRPNIPMPATTEAKEPLDAAPLTMGIREMNGRIRVAIEHLEGLTARLEI